MIVLSDLAWKCPNWLFGLLLPFAIVGLEFAIFRLNFPLIDSKYWLRLNYSYQLPKLVAKLLFNSVFLIVFLGIYLTLSSTFSDNLKSILTQHQPDIFGTIIITVCTVYTTALDSHCFPENPIIGIAENRLENICFSTLENLIDTVLVLAQDGKICKANPPAEALFGRKISALIGCSLSDFLPGLAGTPSNWESRSEQQMIVDCFSKNSTETKHKRIIETTVVQNSKHSIPQYIVMLRDITERKQSEALLKEQARELEQALKKTPANSG